MAKKIIHLNEENEDWLPSKRKKVQKGKEPKSKEPKDKKKHAAIAQNVVDRVLAAEEGAEEKEQS